MSAVIDVSASASNINSLPLTSKVEGVTKAPLSLAEVTVVSAIADASPVNAPINPVAVIFPVLGL